MVGDHDEGMVLFGYTYSVKPFLELYSAVIEPDAYRGTEEGDELSGDEMYIIGISLGNAHS